MKNKTILVGLLALASLNATANPVYEVTAQEARACNFEHKGDCRTFPKGFKFEAMNWEDNPKTVGGKPLAKEGQTGFPEYFDFDGHDVAPVLDAQGNHVEPTCQWPTGGMMQHTVVGPNGQLYLKRVEVVTKCVNGKMTTIQRAIN